MPSSSRFPVLRQTLIVVSFIALVGLFFALNYFIVIPRQQEAYNNRVFRILEETSDAFVKALEDKSEFYKRNPTNTKASKAVDTPRIGNEQTCDTLIKQKILRSFSTLGGDIVKTDEKRKIFTFTADTIKLSILDAKGKKTDSLPLNLLLRETFEPNIQQLHKDEFDMVTLVKRDRDTVKDGSKIVQLKTKDQLLYKFGRLAAGYILPGDTLFKDPRFGQFSSISDITIAGTSYKAFTLPFRFDGNDLMVTGFLREKDYKIATTGYSIPALLWVVFLLTLFFLSLPLIKIYLSSRQERISTADLRMLMVVFVVVPLVATIAAVTMLIYQQKDQATDKDLTALHEKVHTAFTGEVSAVVSQLKSYNQLLKSPAARWCEVYEQNKNRLRKKGDTTDLRNVLFYPTQYPNADDIFWVNDSGTQVAKWFFTRKKEPIYYFDLSPRNYFQRMKANKAFATDGGQFYLEPTISWSSGNYSINVLTSANQPFLSSTNTQDSTTATMIGMGCNLYSVYNPIVTKGYNFCIINTEGEILFHSETKRCLHENVFHESEDDFSLQNAVARKDSELLPDIKLFEHHAKAYVSPVEGMPGFHLISYFNKREQNLFVFHISAFTLLCSAVTLFLLLLAVLLYYFFGSRRQERRVFTYESAWMKPSRAKTGFYLQNIRQLGSVVLLSAALLILMLFSPKDHYWYLLQASVLLPFSAVTGYVLLRNEYNLGQPATRGFTVSGFTGFLGRNWRILLIYFLMAAFVLLSLNYFQEHKRRFLPVFSLLVLVLSLPAIAFRNCTIKPKLSPTKTARYLFFYTLLVFLNTVAISVLPALGIIHFAMNEEKEMEVKAKQFYAATKIDNRRAYLNDYYDASILGDTNLIKQRKLSEKFGMHLLHNQVRAAKLPHRNSVDRLTYSAFYKDVTQFLFLPKDHTDFFDDNGAYFWYKEKSEGEDRIYLAYDNETDQQTKDAVILQQNNQSESLLQTMFSGYAGWLVFLALVAFFIFQFLLIQAVARKIFLLDYFAYEPEEDVKKRRSRTLAEQNLYEPEGKWVNTFFQELELEPTDKTFFDADENTLTSELITKKEAMCPKGFDTEEEQILRIQYLLTPAYDKIWEKLTDKEKLVLYDFALDGFTNYKNVDILYSLYDKGLLKKTNYQLELMNYSFRSYLLGKSGTKEILELMRELSFGSTWKNTKNIFFVTFFAILIFIFATQQDVSNRILAIVSGLATLVPLLLKIFDRNLSGGGPAKHGQ